MKTTQPKYCIYPTLLDAYQQYVDSDIVWEGYWGFSDNPPHTQDEFKELQFKELIDKINRVPYDNDAVAKGTAFNEVIDCMIEHRKSDIIEVERVSSTGNLEVKNIGDDTHISDHSLIGLKAKMGEREFFFPIGLCREFSQYYKDAICQKYVEGDIDTCFGNVKLYGFIDEIMPMSIHDIKTASRYSVGKYKRNNQHLIYPYCVRQMGADISVFEYNVAVIGKFDYETFTETYVFDPQRDIPIIQERCENFIRFVEDNRSLITDKRIFNEK